MKPKSLEEKIVYDSYNTIVDLIICIIIMSIMSIPFYLMKTM